MINNHFKYIIVGAGTAGLHLIKSMSENSFFKDKKILVIDKTLKKSEEKCFSFWENFLLYFLILVVSIYLIDQI